MLDVLHAPTSQATYQSLFGNIQLTVPQRLILAVNVHAC
jgi:hypothetical protein